jgi:hypothetical protein
MNVNGEQKSLAKDIEKEGRPTRCRCFNIHHHHPSSSFSVLNLLKPVRDNINQNPSIVSEVLFFLLVDILRSS